MQTHTRFCCLCVGAFPPSSGIIILGLMLQTHGSPHSLSVILALVGIGFTSINIFGGQTHNAMHVSLTTRVQ